MKEDLKRNLLMGHGDIFLKEGVRFVSYRDVELLFQERIKEIEEYYRNNV